VQFVLNGFNIVGLSHLEMTFISLAKKERRR